MWVGVEIKRNSAKMKRSVCLCVYVRASSVQHGVCVCVRFFSGLCVRSLCALTVWSPGPSPSVWLCLWEPSIIKQRLSRSRPREHTCFQVETYSRKLHACMLLRHRRLETTKQREWKNMAGHLWGGSESSDSLSLSLALCLNLTYHRLISQYQAFCLLFFFLLIAHCTLSHCCVCVCTCICVYVCVCAGMCATTPGQGIFLLSI